MKFREFVFHKGRRCAREDVQSGDRRVMYLFAADRHSYRCPSVHSSQEGKTGHVSPGGIGLAVCKNIVAKKRRISDGTRSGEPIA